ncbi:hypothetical protein ACOACO_03925 [Nocardioides sp. CPCC 205120]|uniref:hypothetical protein n=1 Tax=Nocardioides sp. CPCC 205120 TaxID=3406462 RepID=UPI003B514D2B
MRSSPSPLVHVAPVAWALAGAAALAQALLAWTSRGALSMSTPADVLGLALADRLVTVPAPEVAALLALPVLGAVLLAAAGVGHPVVRRVRAVAGLAAVALTAVLLVRVAGLGTASARPGPGALTAAAGALLALAALTVEALAAPRKENR